jgi:virulence factor Mce-like protein
VTSNARTLVMALLGVAAAVLIAVLALGRDDSYTLKLRMDDAAGLRDGSPVSVGGVRVGKVELHLGDDDKVDVDLQIDNGKRIPQDARVSVSAVNFLGQKQVAFTGGSQSRPAADGFRIAASRVTTSTDLDQVLDTLDTDTRTRLAILVNEAGTAVTGRRWDISRDIQELPTTLSDAHVLLDQLVSDNHTLADVVTSSDRFIAATTAKRDDLNDLIDVLGQSSKTVETKRAELAAGLAKAPRTLATMQGFFGELRRTTAPLGPAARAITATAPALDDTLSRVEGFRKSADPTLRTATSVAPSLTKLGAEASPVIRQAVPTLRSLAELVPAAAPLSEALNRSANNIVGTVGNWSQAIQLRDGLGHIFRGEATYSPNAVASVLDRLTKPASTSAPKPAVRKPTPAKTDATPSPDRAPSTPPAVPADPAAIVTKLLDSVLGKGTKGATGAAVGALLDQVGGRPPADGTAPKSDASVSALLDYLLKP